MGSSTSGGTHEGLPVAEQGAERVQAEPQESADGGRNLAGGGGKGPLFVPIALLPEEPALESMSAEEMVAMVEEGSSPVPIELLADELPHIYSRTIYL